MNFIEPEPTDYPWGLAATFSDPDGNLFSLLQPGGVSSSEEEQESSVKDQKTTPHSANSKTTPSIENVIRTYADLTNGWKKKNFFERQWVQKDFKKETGMSVDQMSGELERTQKTGPVSKESAEVLGKIVSYYKRLSSLLPEFEKDQTKRDKSLREVQTGIAEIESILAISA